MRDMLPNCTIFFLLRLVNGTNYNVPSLLNERRKGKSLIPTKHYYLYLNVIRHYNFRSRINYYFITILQK
jgi:hypothetical protein